MVAAISQVGLSPLAAMCYLVSVVLAGAWAGASPAGLSGVFVGLEQPTTVLITASDKTAHIAVVLLVIFVNSL